MFFVKNLRAELITESNENATRSYSKISFPDILSYTKKISLPSLALRSFYM